MSIQVGVLALDGVVAFDLSVPCQVFGSVLEADGSRSYDMRIVGPSPSVSMSAAGLTIGRSEIEWGLQEARDADVIIVPGVARYNAPVAHDVLDFLRDAAGRGVRIASICTGAFTLAAAGLLDGKRAATHWRRCEELAQMYPLIEVDPDVLYIADGAVSTSAGVAAGLDLCLHLVRKDLGASVAADAARLLVMPLERDGGQAQFILPPAPAMDDASTGLAECLVWMEEHLDQPITLNDIARHAMMSVRTLSRQFRAQVGCTPMQWLLRTRVRHAQELLETTGHSVEDVALLSGFGSGGALRQHFRQRLGTSPQRYRHSLGG